MKKVIRYDTEVAISADSIWAVYSSPDIPRLLRDVLLPGVLEKLDVIQGNGGICTVLDIVVLYQYHKVVHSAVPRSYKEKFINIDHEKRLKEEITVEGGYLDMGCTFYLDKNFAGSGVCEMYGAVPRSYKEKFVNINHEKRLKEVIMIEGGYLDMGCTFYLDRIHVIEKTSKSCVIKSSVVCELKEESANVMSKLITTEPLKFMAEVISNYAIKHQAVFGRNIPKKQSLVKKEIRYDVELPTSVDSIWEVYSSPDILRLLRDVLLPGVFEKLDVIEEDGGVGTVLDIVSPPGVVPRYKEKFVNINHEKRLKEVILIEGGYLDMGYTLYLDRIHVIEKTSKSCVIKSSVVYEVKKACADAISKLITTEP
ncbi:hypothetical protein MKX01_017018 [Papaver californicum]|nr:hypothetical protein MKX01_017018 [Papaver californicum]